jgi:hypothetical protein
MTTDVAALYVEAGGVYAGLPGVDVWDASRDARTYAGPLPVVAHPPCARWSRLAGFCEARYGLRRGDDGGTFAAALEAVRTWGGVLEHPAWSNAWRAFDLAPPSARAGWQRTLDGAWVCEVEQVHFGHEARKATWLYAVRCALPDLWSGPKRKPVARWRISRSASSRETYRDRLEEPEIEKAARIATPAAFRDVLLAMARSVAR